jgi:hypothetical protein
MQMKLRLTIKANVHRVQILNGSQLVQFWMTSDPWLRQWEINMVDMVDLRAKLNTDEWECDGRQAITTYTQKDVAYA